MFRIIICLILMPFLLLQCVRKEVDDGSFQLAKISIVDRNGMTETIATKDRLERFQQVDFLGNQPYQKVLRIFQPAQNGDTPSYITSYHPNGQPKQYLEALNNRAFGKYQEWYANGTLKVDSRVIGGVADINPGAEKTWVFDGCNQAWDEDGNLLADIYYEKGILEGVSVYYHSNGKVWKIVPYQKNLIEGTVQIFQENGELLQETNYHGGLKEGKSLRFWCEGQIASDEYYCEDRLIVGRYYDLSGSLISQIDEGSGKRPIFTKNGLSEFNEYRNGVQEGLVEVFAKNQRLVKKYYIKNQQKQGEEIFYWDDAVYPESSQPKLAPKLSIEWSDGRVNGTVRTWYRNGQTESQKEMHNNNKNGLLTAWYKDGNLMLIEEYAEDKLVRGDYFRRGDKTPVSRVQNGAGVATLYDSEGRFLKKINYDQHKPVD